MHAFKVAVDSARMMSWLVWPHLFNAIVPQSISRTIPQVEKLLTDIRANHSYLAHRTAYR